MAQQFTIPGRLSGYNELNTGHWYARNKLKRDNMERVGWYIKVYGIKPVTGKAMVTIRCYEPTKRRDKSNVRAGAEKLVLDSLQECGIIRNDNWKWLHDKPATVEYDKNARVEVEIEGSV